MDFLRRADALMPQIIKKRVYPLKESEPKDKPMRCGNGFTLDFGSHVVGYLTLNVVPDAVPDSPLEIVFRFAEMPFELDDIPYNGGLSSTWMQKETVYIDCPGTDVITLHRRYAFRYVDVRFPGNTAYSVKYVSSYCTTVSSADIGKLKPLPTDTDSLLMRIDNVAVRTLHNCMQSVFEDGPKRDRRLWLGDLYLQAKANYVTFKNNDLVLRCMYLFAGNNASRRMPQLRCFSGASASKILVDIT